MTTVSAWAAACATFRTSSSPSTNSAPAMSRAQPQDAADSAKSAGTHGDDHSRTPGKRLQQQPGVNRHDHGQPAGDGLRDHHRATIRNQGTYRNRARASAAASAVSSATAQAPRFMSVAGGVSEQRQHAVDAPEVGGEAAGPEGQRPAGEGQHAGDQALGRDASPRSQVPHPRQRARARGAGRPQTPRPHRPRRRRPRTDRLSPAPRTTRPLRFRFPKYDTNARQCIWQHGAEAKTYSTRSMR